TAISGAQINVAWGAALGIVENYQVERRRPNETFALRATMAGDVQLYADVGLLPGSTFEYRVRAMNATGPGGWSNVATATTPSPPTR
ncbi:MAG TPA: fibronectin type III domain-containing protein, partial [Candidatus Eisenbacteria bacterium]